MPYRVGHGNAGLTGGDVKLITVPDKAAGVLTFVPYTVPAGRLGRILFVGARFHAGATVGTRTPVLNIRDAGGIRMFDTYFSDVSANEFHRVMAVSSGSTDLGFQNGGSSRGIPEGPWPEGAHVRVDTRDGLAGDAWSDIRVLVEEWEGV